MELPDLIAKFRSGVFHIFYADSNNKRIGSGSAFTSHNHLITNGHVYNCPPGTRKIWIRRDEHSKPSEGVLLDVSDFQKRRIIASPPEEYDYAVLDVPELRILNPYQFELIGHRHARVGQQVSFLGYPFEKNYVTAHTGIISSLYEEAGTDVIQVDASVNQSNSGGPLFDHDTGAVLGIITRKATGFTETFDALKQTLQNNINILGGVGNSIILQGIGFVDTIRQNQQQVLSLVTQVERSANVGIGYAYSVNNFLTDPLFPKDPPLGVRP